VPTSERLLEERLALALAYQPSAAGLARLDDRMAEAIEKTALDRLGRARVRRPLLRALALVVLLAILIAATLAGATLLDRLVAQVEGWRLAVERSTPLNMSQTVNGVTVTLIGAYADANQVFVSLAGPETPDLPMLQTADGELLFPTFMTASETTQAEGAVAIGGYRTPAGAGELIGPLTLTVFELSRIPGEEIPGPWEFTFSVPNSGGLTLEPGVIATDEGVTVSLERVTITPTSVEVGLDYSGLDDGWEWLPITQVHHGTLEYGVGGGDWLFSTVAGTDSPGGSWTVSVTELVGFRGEEQWRIPGMWELTFEVP
jgi:hypothetical protein